ncbi:hypothetical protein ACFFN3_07020, partial [Leifsonia shinshuensis]
MSNDVAFAPLTVPVLAETETQHAVADAARARGFAAGYADGRRQAAEEQAGWLADGVLRREPARPGGIRHGVLGLRLREH